MIKLSLNKQPKIEVRAVIQSDTMKIIKDKQRKPFINKFTCILSVFLDDSQFTITAPSNYCYDGATIPCGIGKGDMQLLIPALFHDIMCEKKHLINYNRKLSSEIFKELLLLMKVNKTKAQVMYRAVNTYQKFKKGWKVE